MPYKKKSPLASFRDPQKMRRNFNPIDFKMPDLNSIYNKTANGSTVTEDQSTDNKTGSDKEGKTPGLMPKSSSDEVLANIQGTQENTEKKQSAAKQRKSEVREERKKFNKAYRETRQAANMGSKFQTAEEKKKAQEAFGQMKGERNFRKEAKREKINKEDYKDQLGQSYKDSLIKESKSKPLSQNMLNQAHNVILMDNQGKQGKFSHMMNKSERENIPMDRMKITDNGEKIVTSGAGKVPYKKPTKNKIDNLYTQQEQNDDLNEMNNFMDDRKFNAINNPLGRGTRVDKASSMGPFNMVSRKGSAFPMVSDSPLNVVVNNPNQNRNQGVGTGSTVVTNTGTGTGNASGGTGGGGGGTGNGSGGNGSGVTVSAGDGEVNTAITNADGVNNPSGGGNGSGSGVTNPSGGGNNTSAFGSGSVVAGGGDGTVSEVLDSTTGGNSLTYTGGGNTGNTGVQMPSNGLTGGTVAETIKTPESNSPRPTNYRPPNPPPIRREDTIGKDGQIFTPSRAGKGQKTMTNNVLPGISAGSVPSRGIQRDIQFNNKAMSAGELYAPPQPTGMNANTDASLNKTTQGTPMFAAFSDPKQIESNLKEDTENLNNAIDDNMSSVTKTISGMPKPGLEMNASRSSFAKSIDFGSLKKGALREELNVPNGEKIPLNKLETKPGDSKRTKQRKNLAKTMRGFKKG